MTAQFVNIMTSLHMEEVERKIQYVCLFVCWSLTSLRHSNGHIETMSARENTIRKSNVVINRMIINKTLVSLGRALGLAKREV